MIEISAIISCWNASNSKRKHSLGLTTKYLIFYATINNAAIAHISGLADAVLAFVKLQSLYERLGRDGLFLLWKKICQIKYGLNGNYNTFLQKWQAAVTEIRALGDLPLYCVVALAARLEVDNDL